MALLNTLKYHLIIYSYLRWEIRVKNLIKKLKSTLHITKLLKQVRNQKQLEKINSRLLRMRRNSCGLITWETAAAIHIKQSQSRKLTKQLHKID